MTRARHLLSGLTGLATTVILVAGIPIGLVRFVGWPLPTRLPSADEVQLALRSGIDPQLLVKLLAVFVWVVWAMFLWSLIVETTAYLRHRTPNRRPMAPGIQAVAGRLVATVALLAATLTPIRPDVALAQPIPTVIAQDARVVVSTDQTDQTATSNPTYNVQRHDTLWGIADETLGDGRRWQEIRALNLNQPTSTGGTITGTTVDIPAGTSIQLPADATTLPDHASLQTLTVQPGDNFWKIARTVLSTSRGEEPANTQIREYWTRLIEANLDRLDPPHNPDLIHPGQVFILPPIAEPSFETTRTPAVDLELGMPEVVVERGDSFWTIACAGLTDAWGHEPKPSEVTPYWRDVIEANWERLTHPGDPHLIHPGQVLLLPPPPPSPATAATPADTGQPSSDPAPASTRTDSTTGKVGVDGPNPPAAESTESRRPTPTTTQATPPTSTTPVDPIAADATTRFPTPNSDRVTDSGETLDQQDHLLPVGARIAGLGILAAGLIALLNRLRRTQIRQRKPGTAPPPPPPHTRDVETMLRTAAAPTALELVDLSLRAMASQIKSEQLPAPHLVGVEISDTLISLLLWTQHPNPPHGWTATDDGRTWQLPTTVDLTTLRLTADGTPSPYPSLVSIGHTTDTQLLIDLEFLGAVQVTGTSQQVEAACHTFAVELATSQIADHLEVICVGFADDLTHLERIRFVDNLDAILDELADKTAAVETFNVESPLEGRLSIVGGDTWHPMIVIDPSTTIPEHADPLLRMVTRGCAIAAVVGYPTGDRWRFALGENQVHIEPLGLTLLRRDLTPTEGQAVAELIDAAKDAEGVPTDTVETAMDFQIPETDEVDSDAQTEEHPITETIDIDPAEADQTVQSDPPEDQPASEPSQTSSTPSQAEPHLPGVGAANENTGPERELKVLGKMRIEDLDRPFKLASSLEIIAYLAFHRRGVDGHTLMEAIFPEEPPDQLRLNRHISRTRLALGNDPDGKPHLPRVVGGIYRLGPHLHTDVERFEAEVEAADQSTGQAEWDHLRAALDIVEGPPFSGAVAALNWAYGEGVITHLVIAADDAAHRLTALAAEAEDHETATWASRKGLAATGSCDICYRNLMHAAASQSNRTALHALFEEMVALVEDDDGPDAVTQLDSEAVAIYQEHTHPGLGRRTQAS